MLRGCTVFRQMEEERLEQLRNLGERYNLAMGEHRPKLVASSQRLEEPIANCNVRQDMEDVSKKVGGAWQRLSRPMHSTPAMKLNSQSTNYSSLRLQ